MLPQLLELDSMVYSFFAPNYFCLNFESEKNEGILCVCVCVRVCVRVCVCILNHILETNLYPKVR